MIYKAKYIPQSLTGRLRLAKAWFGEDIKLNKDLIRPRLICAGIEPTTASSKLIKVLFGIEG
jgi:hypothetical protein